MRINIVPTSHQHLPTLHKTLQKQRKTAMLVNVVKMLEQCCCASTSSQQCISIYQHCITRCKNKGKQQCLSMLEQYWSNVDAHQHRPNIASTLPIMLVMLVMLVQCLEVTRSTLLAMLVMLTMLLQCQSNAGSTLLAMLAMLVMLLQC